MDLKKLKYLSHIASVCSDIVNNPDQMDIKFTGQDLQISFLDVILKTDGNNFSSTIGDIRLDLKIENEENLYNYVAVQVMRVTGMDLHKEQCITPFDLSEDDINQIKRISRYESEYSGMEIFNDICYNIGSPYMVALDLHVSERLVKNIRVLNRKNIIAYSKNKNKNKGI